MSFNGTGTFVINSSGQPAVTGAIITATAFNALTADLASGLSNCITRDGQGLPTATIPWNGQSLTGVNTLSAVTATISGNSTIGGTLGVTGTLTASGNATVGGTLGVTGTLTATGAVAAASMTIGGNTVATLAGPTFTGTPSAPTAAAKTATTQLATTAFVDGLRSLLSSATSGTLVLSDRGTLVPITANIAVPNSVFSANDVVTIYNNSAGSLTITASITTLRLGGTATTGNRTLAQRGIATIVFISGTEAVISGAGVT